MRKFVLAVVVGLICCGMIVPVGMAKASGGPKGDVEPGWYPVTNPVPNPSGPGYKIQAIRVNEFGDTEQTVTSGVAKNKRQARKASKKLAESCNAGGAAFKWEPGCEGLLC